MVMIIPEAPKQKSFGSQFGERLGGGIGEGLSGSIKHFIDQKKQAQDFANKMELQKAKQKSYEGLFGKPREEQEDEGQVSQGQGFKPLDERQEAMLALTDPNAFKAYNVLKESNEKKQEKEQQKENLKGSVKDMIDTLLKGNLGKTPKRFLEEGRRDSQYFDSLAVQLESIGKEMVSKGVLSAPRFAFLLGSLPSSDKTDASNAGSLEAWVKELNLDIPEVEQLKPLYDKKSKNSSYKKQKLKNVRKGTLLTEDALREIIDVVGEENAEATARKMGYAFDD